MRIALLTQGAQDTGGVRTVVDWLRDGLVRRGHELTVVNVATSRADAQSRRLLDPRTWLRGPAAVVATHDPDLLLVGSIAAEVEALRYSAHPLLTRTLAAHDVVLVVAGGPALAAAAARCGRPVVLQVATTVAWERESILRTMSGGRRWASQAMTRWVSRLETRALRACHTVLVENPVMGAEVQRLAPSAIVTVAPPGVDTTVFARSTPWSSEGPIVSVGRLQEARKGWGLMFQAYAKLVASVPDAPRLIVAGRGHLLPQDQRTLDALALGDRVEVRSDLSLDEVRELLHQGSVFWQTSFEEGLGLAVIEAMAAGLPVVTTSTAGTDMSVVDGVTGALVPQNSEVASQFVERTRAVLSDDGTMATASEARARETFDSTQLLAVFDQALERAVGDHRS